MQITAHIRLENDAYKMIRLKKAWDLTTYMTDGCVPYHLKALRYMGLERGVFPFVFFLYLFLSFFCE